MEMMEVEVVLRETIKPSSPTPEAHRTFKLSFLDQLVSPPIYLPIILFFNTDRQDLIIGRCDHIKKSLSKTLTRYYPLAGRIKEDNFVDCNDDGVVYLETRVKNVSLSQVIQHQPDVNVMMEQLLPPCKSNGSESDPVWLDYGFNSKVLLAVQVNAFDCGGMAIGVCGAHRLVDASTLANFITDWAAIAQGSTEQIKGTSFDSPYLFPQRDLMGIKIYSELLMKEEEIVTKNFVFGASKIAQLKKRNMSNRSPILQKYPNTRVEAISAFLSMRFLEVIQAKDQAAAGTRVDGVLTIHTVNIRARMIPPLPTNSFGNLYGVSMALSIPGNNDNYDDDEGSRSDHQYLNLVGNVKDAIKKINDDYVRTLQKTDTHLDILEFVSKTISSGQTLFLSFTSWCRFPLYETDFGWGKPIWVTSGKLPLKNVVVVIDTNSGDGIEAWVNMTKEDMAEFKRDEELLAFVS